MSAETQSTVQVDFTMGIGSGRLDASLQVPAGDVTITQLLPVLQTLSSSVVGSVVQIVEAEGESISCKAGCGACCRQLVPLSLFEAEYLAGWIRTLPQERQDELERRFHAALSQLHGSGMLARMDTVNWVKITPETKEVAAEYLSQRIPCPFLENESCGIHPIRPLICREYLVTSPPEFCFMPTVDKVVGVPMPIKLSNVMFHLGGQVEGSSRGWMPLVFLFVWMKQGGRPGDAIFGPGPEILHEIVNRLATSEA